MKEEAECKAEEERRREEEKRRLAEEEKKRQEAEAHERERRTVGSGQITKLLD